jgi:hypothetical protein
MLEVHSNFKQHEFPYEIKAPQFVTNVILYLSF